MLPDPNITVLYSPEDFIKIRGDKVPADRHPEKYPCIMERLWTMEGLGGGGTWFSITLIPDGVDLEAFCLGYKASGKVDRSV